PNSPENVSSPPYLHEDDPQTKSARYLGAFIWTAQDILGPREGTAPECGSRTTQGTDTSLSALQTLRAVRLRRCWFAFFVFFRGHSFFPIFLSSIFLSAVPSFAGLPRRALCACCLIVGVERGRATNERPFPD